ncbi:MAG: hypothetical protein IT227_14995 [Flavobacteriales bacterium]|nr:hypothetical protein [Flavobacteriales bacterium]
MRELLVRITNPDKEKLVTDILHEIDGVAVERIPKTTKVPGRPKAKAAKRKLTTKEKRFVADIKQAVKEVKDHISGKRKLQSAREFLNEL